MATDGLTLAIGGTALGAVCTLVGSYIRARYSRTRIEPQPLEVVEKRQYVTCDECRAHRDRIAARFDAMGREFSSVKKMMRENNDKVIDRFDRLNDRLSPVIQSVAGTTESLRQHLEDHRAKEAANHD